LSCRFSMTALVGLQVAMLFELVRAGLTLRPQPGIRGGLGRDCKRGGGGMGGAVPKRWTVSLVYCMLCAIHVSTGYATAPYTYAARITSSSTCAWLLSQGSQELRRTRMLLISLAVRLLLPIVHCGGGPANYNLRYICARMPVNRPCEVYRGGTTPTLHTFTWHSRCQH
jgi:hypothetical protein